MESSGVVRDIGVPRHTGAASPLDRAAGEPVPITVAYGDGIGPEIMTATLRILRVAGAALDIDPVDIGESAYLRGVPAGIGDDAWESLRRTRVFLKAPITTPQGGGYKSLNVTVRKAFGLFANVRPCQAYAPFVATGHPGMDVVIIRENEEDLYGGIEHRQTDDVVQCLKLISRPGTERLVRYAFEYARRHGRRKVSCFTKDNIMKLTDGLFHQVFDEVAAEYPDLESEHLIVDIGTARLASSPSDFDVIAAPNLYGDIISDVAAEIAGSVGMGGSANVGASIAMFEAIHGSAPVLAGQGVANPSGLLLAAVQMLVHIGQGDVATRVHNAWLATIEDGVHTGDIYQPGVSAELAGTEAFADAVIGRLGSEPQRLSRADYPAYAEPIRVTATDRTRAVKEQVGIDVFADWTGSAEELGKLLDEEAGPDLRLVMVTNRGQKVYPGGMPETYCVDHWRCRFESAMPGQPVTTRQTIALLERLDEAGVPFIKTEGLYTFDGAPGYSLGQGQ